MFKKVLFFIIGVLVIFLLVQLSGEKNLETKLTIANSEIIVEIADAQEKRTQGLSDRISLEEKHGMFFIFDEIAMHSFWMKDMNFPIDIIWIGEDLKIIDMDKNVSPESFPQSFFPSVAVKYVLETNAGWAEENNIQTGDEVDKNF